METLLQDLRHARRALARRPGRSLPSSGGPKKRRR